MKKILAIVTVLAMVFTAATVLAEGIMGMYTGSKDGIDFAAIGEILLFLIGLYVVSSFFSLLQGFIMTHISVKLTYRMRKDISEKLNRLPLSYFDKTSNGEILSRVTNDIDTLSQSLNQSLTQIITSVTQLIGILIMMISISWQMTLIADSSHRIAPNRPSSTDKPPPQSPRAALQVPIPPPLSHNTVSASLVR